MKPHRAKKSLGQNFLVDANYQRKIRDAVRAVYNGETVIEIGPGQGALTGHLAEFAQRLVLVEKDYHLGAALQERFAGDDKVEIVVGDFLQWDLAGLETGRNIVVANLPYNVSTQILIRLLKNFSKFTHLFLMFQKEVAHRSVSKHGSKDFGILSVWCQLLGRPEKICDVPPTAFRPQPKITSTVLKFTPSETPYDDDQEKFMTFVKRIFSQRRKKIGSLLKGEKEFTALKATGGRVSELLDLRAEAITIAEMQLLFELFKSPESD